MLALPLWYRPSNSSYHACYILILTMHIQIYLLRNIPVQTSIRAIIIASNIRNLIHALILIIIQLSKSIARFVLLPFTCNCIIGCITSAWTYQRYVCSFNNIGYAAFIPWKCITILFIKTLEKPEGAIKNGQSRDTGYIRHTRHRGRRQTAPNTQHRKLKWWATWTSPKKKKRKKKGWIQVLAKGK